ncbi:MAG TPA: oligosaccharide flippase family protein [Ktedonobacterales bacterium]|nr:oligosaccharide flippase family protein [Ktedonobacterales bacterium]
MSQTRRVVKNSSYLMIAQAPVQAANAVYVLILAQRLGVLDFGRFATLWALLAFFQTVIEQGLGRSITRDIASRTVSLAEGVVNGLVLALGLGLLSVGAMTALGWALAAVLGHAPDFVMLAFLAGASLAPRAIWQTASAVFNAQQRMGASAVLSVIASLGNVGIGLALLAAGQGLPGVLVASALAQILPLVVAIALLFRIIWPGEKAVSRAVMLPMGRAATPFVVRALLGIVYFRADLLLLTTLAGFEAAGVYQAAYKVLELALILPGAANSAAYPVISAYLVSNRARAARAYQRLLGGTFVVGLPLSALLFVGAAPLVDLLYGAAYSAAVPMLQILAGAILLSYVNAAPITLLAASPRQTALTMVTAVGLVVNLAVNALLIPSLTGQGAALAMIASEAVQCLLLFGLTGRVLRGANIVRAPEITMMLGLALSAFLAFVPRALPDVVPQALPQSALGVALDPAWFFAIPGIIVYLVGVALYGRELLAERAFGASADAAGDAAGEVWDGEITPAKAGAQP